jgi:hypothetical protein
MCLRSRTEAAFKALAGVVVLGAMLGGCSDIYYDRRDNIALGGDDPVATNKVTQMVDPWPRYSARRNIAFNGERMQAAHERYRQNRVIPPVNATTSSVAYQQAQQAAQTVAPPPPPSTAMSPAAAAVK